MKKTKKQLTRKRRALRRSILLVAVIALLTITDLYYFFPMQAVKVMADMKDVEQPVVVKRLYGTELPRNGYTMRYLIDGEQAVMLCTVGYNPFMGWYDGAYSHVEKEKGRTLHAGLETYQKADTVEQYLFGRIDDPEITQLVLLFRVHIDWEQEYDWQMVTIPKEDLFEKDGKHYFLSQKDIGFVDGGWWEFELHGLNEQGSVIETAEVHWTSWSG